MLFEKRHRSSLEVSVVLPCQNEELAISKCIIEIKDILSKNSINGEIIVSDSSSDKSPEIASTLGAVVIRHGRSGYGSACLEGFKVAKGRYIFMADADGTYDFKEIPGFIARLKEGNDLIIGNRFMGRIDPGAMPLLHRYFGSPILSFFSRFFWGVAIRDINCGLRAIRRSALEQLNLKTTGMESASEMIIKATLNNLRIKEVPINYHQRLGRSKMRSWVDGWRHLKFMLGVSRIK